MKSFFDTYDEALTEAQSRANQSGMAVGIERFRGVDGYRKGFKVRYLPREDKRFGCDLRCEVVEPEVKRG